MDSPLTYGSVCSGIEAASVAWECLGWQPAWFAEFDKAPSQVLAHRFPDVVNHGDMTVLPARVLSGEIAAPDILVGGTPCQSFSVAGLRGGLSDARGQLTLAFIILADAIDQVRAARGLPPVIVVWENVPGVLNHDDNPLGCFLAGLCGDDEPAEPGPRPEPRRSATHWTWKASSGQHSPKWPVAGAVAGPVRTASWRILNAEYFGLAQRRRRVFLVASARQGFDPAGVFLEFDGVRRDTAPSREAGQGVAAAAAHSAADSGVTGADRRVCSADELTAVPQWWDGRDVSQTLDAVLHKGQTMPEKNRFPAVLQPIAFNSKDFGADATEGLSPTLRASGFSGSHANGGAPPAIAYADTPAVCVTGSVTHTLKAEGFDASKDGTGRGQPIVCGFQASQSGVRMQDVAGTLDSNYGSRRHNGVLTTWAVRRLMPVECERLQGFPDGWTDVPVGKRRAADGPRYKQLGNSMAVPCMRWIGRRIAAQLTGIGHNGGPVFDEFEALL